MANKISENTFFENESNSIKESSLVYIYGFDPAYFQNKFIVENLNQKKDVHIVVPETSDISCLVNDVDIIRVNHPIPQGFRTYNFKNFVYFDLTQTSPIESVPFRQSFSVYEQVSMHEGLMGKINESRQYFGDKVITDFKNLAKQDLPLAFIKFNSKYLAKWNKKKFDKIAKNKDNYEKVA